MWLFLRRAGGADVKFHADRRNFCRREYILCMKRTITVSIVRSCTVKSRSPPPRESYTICSFMVGRRQLVTSSSSPPKEPIVQLLQCDEFSSTTPPLSLSLSPSIVLLQPLNLPIGEPSARRTPRSRLEKKRKVLIWIVNNPSPALCLFHTPLWYGYNNLYWKWIEIEPNPFSSKRSDMKWHIKHF